MPGFKERDITGQTFGHLTAIHRLPGTVRARWLFRCSCGVESPILKGQVVRGAVKQCVACGHRLQAQLITKHGASKRDPRYQIFHAAKNRCNNPSDDRYADYGGRGIKFLFHSFEEFIADVGERPPGTLLDRRDNSKHYEPGNMRWVTPLESARNRRPKKNPITINQSKRD